MNFCAFLRSSFSKEGDDFRLNSLHLVENYEIRITAELPLNSNPKIADICQERPLPILCWICSPFRCTMNQMHEQHSASGIDAAFEKVTFENDASILFKHVTARRFRFVYHYHPEIELVYFAEGDGLEFIGDSTQAFKAGHLVLLGSNLPHLWINDVECEYAEACVVQFKKEILGDFLLLLPEMARIRLLMESAARGVVFSKLATLEVVPLLTRLEGETGAKRLLTLLEILAVLSRDAQSCKLCATSSHVQHSAEDKRRIDGIYRHLSEHFRESCPVREVAQAIGMNERTFSRYFRRETGRNYIEALLDLRLSYACRLLKESDKTITETAYECGFTNLANFNRQFRRHYRMTPREYRKRWAEEELPSFTEKRA
jgi:AraC-like DNA-binding protein